jgi:hypothetical protein
MSLRMHAGARPVLDVSQLPESSRGFLALPPRHGQHGRAVWGRDRGGPGALRRHLHHLPRRPGARGAQQEAALQPCLPHALPAVRHTSIYCYTPSEEGLFPAIIASYMVGFACACAQKLHKDRVSPKMMQLAATDPCCILSSPAAIVAKCCLPSNLLPSPDIAVLKCCLCKLS